MKIMQITPHPEIEGVGIVAVEYPQYATLEEAQSYYDPEVVNLVEVPDYVFPQWIYHYDHEGDDRFEQPRCEEGMHYNESRGYVEWDDPIHDERMMIEMKVSTPEKTLAQLEDQRAIIDEKIASMHATIKSRSFSI